MRRRDLLISPLSGKGWKRRAFLALFAGAAASMPLAAHAQQRERVRRIGIILTAAGADDPKFQARSGTFLQELSQLGWGIGRNLRVHPPRPRRRGDRIVPRFLRSTCRLLAHRDMCPRHKKMVANWSNSGHRAEFMSTRPNIGAELAGKRLEILKEIIPAVSKVAVLINSNDPIARSQMDSAKAAARTLAVHLEPILEIRSANDLNNVFEAATRARAGAALRMIDPLESALRRQTVALAAEHRLPIIYPFREAVEFGGLVSYGTNLPDQFRQAATFVHKIFNGAKPIDLPVEQPSRFELVINLKTAKALGITMPLILQQRADEVIE